MWSICVHGGASDKPLELASAHQSGCSVAVERGARLLSAGGLALDAVAEAVRVLEDNPVFNAGTGGALDARGLAAHDAAVMRGQDLAYGAVGAVLGLKNPVDGALAVLNEGRHCLLVGRPALDFCRSAGVATISPELHVTPEARSRFAAGETQRAEAGGSTVGAVALDQYGGLAAATSTGGLKLRRAGRVGDSPIAGAGTYADGQLGALSATGHGETMMRTVFAYRALLSMESVEPTRRKAALNRTLDEATQITGGRGGAIVVLPDGDIVHARNAIQMGVALLRAGEGIRTDF